MFDPDGGGLGDPSVVDFPRGGERGGGIRCPLCGWRPSRGDEWVCGCGEEWNTFATRGRCPACTYQWAWTECLHCHRRSAHERWYA